LLKGNMNRELSKGNCWKEIVTKEL
jgi:hypothetical protein